MAKKGSFSKVYDKNGDYVDVEAARFDGTRTFQMQGDVTASQTWNGDPSSPLTLNASIGAKKVTTDKINDKAVQTGQIDDGAVGLTQIATNAMNGTVQDNDSKLATHAAVKTYVDAQISGQGTYLGKHTVAEINAMVTDNLHNGDRVMTSDSGTINLGPGGVGFDVEVGEDLILYKSGSTVQWDSMDGNFKTKQTAVSDPTASGTGLTFIDSASQDENGEMTLSKKTVQDGTTSQKGVVQLEDSHSSTSTTKAATPNSVKEAYDLANTANTGAVKNVAYDSTNKKITKTINGTTTDVVSAATLKTDMALNNVDNTSDANKPVSTAQQAALDLKLDKTGDGKDVTATFTEASTRANIGTGEKLSVIFGKIKKWFSDLGTAAFKNVPASGNASSTEVVLGSDTRLSAGASAVQDVTVDGTSVVNSSKVAVVPNASTSAKGAVQLAGSIGATVASENNKAATEKAVRDAINALDAEVTSIDGTNVQVKVTEADGKISAVNVTTDDTENKNNKVSAWQSTPDNTHYPSEKLVKDGLDAKVTGPSSATADDIAVFDGTTGKLVKDGGKKISDLAQVARTVAIADCRVQMNGHSGWYNVASATFALPGNNFVSSWIVTLYATNSSFSAETFIVNLSIRQNSGANPVVYAFNAECINKGSKNGFNANNFKVVVEGTSSLTIELWYSPGATTYGSMILRELNAGQHTGVFSKSAWTYHSKSNVAGQTTEPTGTVAELCNFIYAKNLQTAVSDPTASGTALSFIDSITQNENGVVTVTKKTVSDATTSEHGLMSATDKTKLDGIAEGAEVNVQVDWDETSSSADSFIKNKPYHVKYQVQAGSYKVCSMPKLDNGNEKCLGLEFTYVKGYGGLKGTLLYKNNFKLYLQYCNNPGMGSKTITFKYVNNETTVDLYAITSGISVTLKIAPLANMPKSDIDFTDFGTSATVPEGASEITPVWVANSASSSGTAPVKVDAYGTLTPVPMDSTPTASSTNLMTSMDIKTALDKKQDAIPILFYGIKVVKKVTESKNDNIGFEVYTNFAANACTVKVAARLPAGTASVPYNTDSILRRYIDGNIETSLRLLDHVYYKVDGENIELYFLNNIGDYSRRGIIKTTTGVISGVSYEVLTSSVSTTGLTALSYTVNGAGTFIPHTNTAVGSATTPVFADAKGEITACTDDFVHDGDVAQTYSSTSEAPISGKGVAEAISAVTLSQLNGILLTSSDDIDTLVLPVGNNYAATEKWYYTRSSEGLPQHMPEDANTAAIRLIASNAGADRTIQFVYPAASRFFFTRYKTGTGWTSWEKVYFAPTSSYSPTGAASVRAVNGAAVAAALATSLTDVEYVAAQSGGGGNLNKTKNGSTTSVLPFMTTAEAHSLWTNAKANAS